MRNGGIPIRFTIAAVIPELELLLGDPTKARGVLGWEPNVKFAELVGTMVRADLADQGREAYRKEGGFEVKRYHE